MQQSIAYNELETVPASSFPHTLLDVAILTFTGYASAVNRYNILLKKGPNIRVWLPSLRFLGYFIVTRIIMK